MGHPAFSRIMIPRLPLRLRSGLRQSRDFGSGLRRPLGASTFCCYHRPIRLLRCAQSLRAGSGCLPRTKADESSSQLGARAAQLQASRLRVRSHAGACSLAAQRTTRGYVQRNCPTQAKRRLEWATRAQRTTTGYAGRGAEVVEARSSVILQPRRLIGDAEHFWQKRYYDFNIRNYPQFVEKLRYIHRNPVKAGLCERPEDWEWSSFRHYATGCEGRVEIESEWTARKRERAAGRLCPAVELPHSSQNRA
jgi:REP element-mobilizing transposase RayT